MHGPVGQASGGDVHDCWLGGYHVQFGCGTCPGIAAHCTEGPYPASLEQPGPGTTPLLLPPDDELPLLDEEDAVWSGPPASSAPAMPVLEHAPCRPAAMASDAAQARTGAPRFTMGLNLA